MLQFMGSQRVVCSFVGDASLWPQLPPSGSGSPHLPVSSGGWAGLQPASSAQSFVVPLPARPPVVLPPSAAGALAAHLRAHSQNKGLRIASRLQTGPSPSGDRQARGARAGRGSLGGPF